MCNIGNKSSIFFSSLVWILDLWVLFATTTNMNNSWSAHKRKLKYFPICSQFTAAKKKYKKSFGPHEKRYNEYDVVLYNGYKSIGDAEKVEFVVFMFVFFFLLLLLWNCDGSSRLNKSFRYGSKTLLNGEMGMQMADLCYCCNEFNWKFLSSKTF